MQEGEPGQKPGFLHFKVTRPRREVPRPAWVLTSGVPATAARHSYLLSLLTPKPVLFSGQNILAPQLTELRTRAVLAVAKRKQELDGAENRPKT